jgi:hypothetical protein
MHMPRLVLASTFLVFLGAEVTFLSGQANAMNCCPCWKPCNCGSGLVCRGTSHCPRCSAASPDLFQGQAVAIRPVSDFGASHEVPSFTPPTVAFSTKLIGFRNRSSRALGDQSLRFLNSEQFAFKFWCTA